jgi:hypothetical protein
LLQNGGELFEVLGFVVTDEEEIGFPSGAPGVRELDAGAMEVEAMIALVASR